MDETHLIAESRLRVTLFGTFKLDAPDGEEVVVPGKRARALLAILCLEPGVAVERGGLAPGRKSTTEVVCS